MSDVEWSEQLHRARRAVGLTQTEVAALAGLSMQTVRAYERRRRHPTRYHLVAMLDALRVPRGERNAILTSAGFAPDDCRPPSQAPPLAPNSTEAAEETERVPWPAFVVDEFATLLSANRVAQRLWGIEPACELAQPAARSLLAVLSEARLADRIANWDEAFSIVVAVFKGRHPRAEDLDHPDPQARAVLGHIFRGDPQDVARFMRVWHATGARVVRERWSYPIAWRGLSGGMLRFHCLVSAANDDGGLTFHDWIPLDGSAWAALAALDGC
ncbi:MAG: helix-turn-helix domain-containing protein [Dehalococcoidia bacterium]